MACSPNPSRISADKLQYRFRLRPEAHFSDGSKLTAADVAFSLTTLKEKAHPVYAILLREMASAKAESDDVALIDSPRTAAATRI